MKKTKLHLVGKKRVMTIFYLANLYAENVSIKCMAKVEQAIQKISTITMFVVHEEKRNVLVI